MVESHPSKRWQPQEVSKDDVHLVRTNLYLPPRGSGTANEGEYPLFDKMSTSILIGYDSLLPSIYNGNLLMTNSCTYVRFNGITTFDKYPLSLGRLNIIISCNILLSLTSNNNVHIKLYFLLVFHNKGLVHIINALKSLTGRPAA